MKTFHGELHVAADAAFAIVVSRFNETITKKLLEGAVSKLRAAGVADEKIDVAWVPGAFEIPLVADKMAGTGRYAAVLCLGAVIRGDTSHDQHINRAVSIGIMEANMKHAVPVLFGVLTCDTVEQAIQRSGGGVVNEDGSTAEQARQRDGSGGGKPVVSNKGVECATAALEMVSLLRKLKDSAQR
jgi:6,7-dimethyl-8-ribityllumazine synthase